MLTIKRASTTNTRAQTQRDRKMKTHSAAFWIAALFLLHLSSFSDAPPSSSRAIPNLTSLSSLTFASSPRSPTPSPSKSSPRTPAAPETFPETSRTSLFFFSSSLFCFLRRRLRRLRLRLPRCKNAHHSSFPNSSKSSVAKLSSPAKRTRSRRLASCNRRARRCCCCFRDDDRRRASKKKNK